MKTIKGVIIGGLALFFSATYCVQAQLLSVDPSELPLVSPENVPLRGATFWIKEPNCRPVMPLPFIPNDALKAPVYALPNGAFYVDNSELNEISLMRSAGMTSLSSFELPTPGEGGGSGNSELLSPDPRRNYAKFQNQIFSVIDTNNAAVNDTNLFNACVAFGDNTNSEPNLQIAAYGTDAVIIKANHFDYSAETDRDFALIVCDKVETPVWKSIDFQSLSDAQDGWLVQGSVPHDDVIDPMYFKISNITRDANAFFQVIPYAGPQIVLSGPQPYDTVSNTITIQASIVNLSGVTNEHFEVTVEELPARYGLETNNNITLNTKYNPAGWHNVNLQISSRVSVYDLTNAPADVVLGWDALAVMPLDFENDNYVVSLSTHASPEIGTNWFLFYVTKEQGVDCKIINPANGQVVMYYTNYVAGQTTVEVPWNFTETNGVTPYTNDNYIIKFTAYDPDTFDGTNTIDRTGVRNPSGCFISYQELDSSDPDASYLNQRAETWLNGTLKTLYRDLYRSFGITQYGSFQVGTNRNHSDCISLSGESAKWETFMKPAMSNLDYSDLTIGQSHGGDVTIGGAPADKFYTITLNEWITNASSSNWRLRKAAFWSCNSGHYDPPYMTFPEACGVRPTIVQKSSYIRKNCALVFKSSLPFGGFYDGAVTAQVAESFDQTWICGKNQYPGGCDPTYSFEYALNRTKGINGPQLRKAQPFIEGYPFMTYSSVYDDELLLLNTAHVKTH